MNTQNFPGRATSRFPTTISTRVYAGVLGKLIGVYLGRPFEQWTHQRIMQRARTDRVLRA